MTNNEILAAARENIDGRCKACPVCNGKACIGIMPGPGGKGTGQGFIRNYEAFRNIKINMDTIYAQDDIDVSVDLFGKKFSMPIFPAPIATVPAHYGDYMDDAKYGKLLFEGCGNVGVLPFTGDGVNRKVSFSSYVDLAKVNDGLGIPTIKPWTVDAVQDKIRECEAANCFAIAMDIDGAGLRHLQMTKTQPVGAKTVKELKAIISATETPFIIKGIMTVEGARKAYEAGAAGIVVSNHGGRVLDDTPATIEVLPEIAKEFKGKMKIFIDGGIRTGVDLFKALALGADAALIGRPVATYIYGGGVEGFELLMSRIAKELEDTMMMTGCLNLSDITADKVICL